MPTITALKRFRFKKDKYKLFIDGSFAANVPDYLIEKYKLRAGINVPESAMDEIRAEADKINVEESAYRYLSIRPHSTLELIQKLRKKGFDKKLIHEVIEKFKDYNYLDDKKFAESWIKARINSKPRGRRLLVSELRRKGVSQKTADEVIAEAFEETSEQKLALILLEKNRNRFLKEKPVDLRLKIRNFLSYRGFGFDVIREVSEKFIERLENEEIR